MILKIKKKALLEGIIYGLVAVFFCVLFYYLGTKYGNADCNSFYAEYLENCICKVIGYDLH